MKFFQFRKSVIQELDTSNRFGGALGTLTPIYNYPGGVDCHDLHVALLDLHLHAPDDAPDLPDAPEGHEGQRLRDEADNLTTPPL